MHVFELTTSETVGTVSGTVTCCLVIRCLPRRSFSSRDL
jgi:hypothetical protein